MQYSTISIQYNTTQHNTAQHSTTQYNTTQHNSTQRNTTPLSIIKYTSLRFPHKEYSSMKKLSCIIVQHQQCCNITFSNFTSLLHSQCLPLSALTIFGFFSFFFLGSSDVVFLLSSSLLSPSLSVSSLL